MEQMRRHDLTDQTELELKINEIESERRTMTYLRWFIHVNFFSQKNIDKLKQLYSANNEMRYNKQQAYEEAIPENQRDHIKSSSLFVDKMIEESNLKGEINYPLCDILDFLKLIKGSAMNKIKDCLILYTLLEMSDSSQRHDNDKIEQFMEIMGVHKYQSEVTLYKCLDEAYQYRNNQNSLLKQKIEEAMANLQLESISQNSYSFPEAVFLSLFELGQFREALILA